MSIRDAQNTSANQNPVVRTVLGDIDATGLGVTNAHDHLFFASPLLPGQELDAVEPADAELRAFAAAGGGAVVQWTPAGLGRRRPELARLSRATGIPLVSATGRHRAAHHPAAAAAESGEDLAERFIDDLTAATEPCGVIKIGTGYHHLDEFERASLTAAANAHRATGAPVVIHLELGTAGGLVVDHLGRADVDPTSIVLGHLGRNPDPVYLREIATLGTFLCFDGPSRANHQTDWRLLPSLHALADIGHLDRLLLGGDTTTSAARSVTGGPGMPGLLTTTARRLRAELGDEAWGAVLVDNPARAFAWRTPTV